MHKKLVVGGTVWFSVLIMLAMLLPMVLVKKHPSGSLSEIYHPPVASSTVDQGDTVAVPVYMTHQHKVEVFPLEQYVKGVVAAEMPIEFEPEALKAQALAARTYLVKRMLDNDHSNVPDKEALVTDSEQHQAFMTEEDMKIKWPGPEYTDNMKKLNRAVEETKDKILTWQGLPINAVFFSTSNGYTENSEEYWADYTPYLRSVPSPWDVKLSPKYKTTAVFNEKDVLKKLGVNRISPNRSSPDAIKIISRTAGHRIKTISIGNKRFTGREVREKLGLASSQFDWRWDGDQIAFTTYGNGHGVGMSQWGANGMAKEGKTAEEIVKYYYKGIDISQASTILHKK